jgi:hypothetical protein
MAAGKWQQQVKVSTALHAWWCWQVRKLAWRITLFDGQKHDKKYVHV